MHLHGSFLTQSSDTITVHILTQSDPTDERIIGTPESGIYFTDDPIDIESQVTDTFDHILPSQATIRLLTTSYIPQLFTTTHTHAIVNIYRADTLIFAGYIEPRAYSQPYNEQLDQLELSCIDHLTAIADLPYRLLTTDAAHQAALATADQLTFQQLITDIIATPRLDILHPTAQPTIYYDGSKAILADDELTDDPYLIFTYITINELLPLSTSRDDQWTQADTLTAILRYLNLHIIQQGTTYYIYSWETIRAAQPIEWHDLLHPLDDNFVHTTQPQTIPITTAIATDTDTEFSLADIYNHILLTCKPTAIDDLIQSPLDDELLTSPYRAKQRLLTEYLGDENDITLSAMQTYVFTNRMDSSHIWANDWYIQVMSNPQWTFPAIAHDTTLTNHLQSSTYQETIPHHLASHLSAALLSVGKTTQTYQKQQDGTLDTKIEMTPYLYISVNGNTSDTDPHPTADELLAAAPIATYDSSIAGGLLSPADQATTNYIVISGKIALQPILPATEAYNPIHDDDPTKGYGTSPFTPEYIDKMYFNRWYGETVPVDSKSDGYRVRKYYRSPDPTGIVTPTTQLTIDHEQNERGAHTFIPFDTDSRQSLPFNYSAIGDSDDHVRKLGVIACMLIVGKKCLVETGTSGTPDDYQWRYYKKLEDCADEDEYYAQTFTIGFDPSIGDNLLGKEFPIQNNITHPLGIDAEGTAIPIRYTDHLSGRVTFHILGAANLTYDQITRRHPTWFRHTKWSTTAIPLMAHVQNIVIKEFEIKVHSDNAHITHYQDHDIIYQSDTDETFTNSRDDIEFPITSALTSEECFQLGTTTALSLSTATTIRDNQPQGLLTIYNIPKHTLVKPEQDYIDSYYDEYHTPHILLTQSLTDTTSPTSPHAGIITPFNHYTHPALGRTFYPIAINRNLQSSTATLTLKEL